MNANLNLLLDNSRFEATLASLTEAADRFPEFCDALLSFLETGEEPFLIKDDGRRATATGEFVVGLDPSDGLLRCVAAFRAGNPNFRLIEHLISPVAQKDKTTTVGAMQ
ncbi:hypothetical protein CN120_15710 [Sinorhizobium meliloti]|uniref:hypothetical protein n=1 Tax=Rhizobium meliloti TaxID=382 RepID=UPI000FD866EE|nr:hypothetical protein [Sinorhizobium meliloti]RVN03997.1 hypothetical protein CN120_15710 [Sinorhizobium meliloti]